MATDALRRQLDQHGYSEYFSADSAPLVNKIFYDLVKALNTLKVLAEKYETLKKSQVAPVAKMPPQTPTKLQETQEARIFRLSRLAGSVLFICDHVIGKQTRNHKWTSASLSLLNLLLSYESAVGGQSQDQFPPFIKEFHEIWKITEERDMLIAALNSDSKNPCIISVGVDPETCEQVEFLKSWITAAGKERDKTWSTHGEILPMVNGLKNENENLKGTIRELQREVHKLVKSHRGSRHRRSVSSVEHASRPDESASDSAELDSSGREICEEAESYEGEDCGDLTNQVNHVRGLNILQRSLAVEKENSKRLHMQLQRLSDSKNEADVLAAQYSYQICSLQKSLQVCEAQLGCLSKHNSENSESAKHQENLISRLEQELTNLTEIADNLRDDLKQCDACKTVFEQALIKLNKMLEAEKQARIDCTAEKEKALFTYHQEIDELNRLYNAACLRVTSLTGQLDEQIEQKKAAIEKLAATSQELEHTLGALDELSASLSHSQEQEKALKMELESLNRVLKQSTIDRDRLKLIADSAQNERDDALAVTDEWRRKCKSLKMGLESVEERHKNLLEHFETTGGSCDVTSSSPNSHFHQSDSALVKEVSILTSMKDNAQKDRHIALEKCKAAEHRKREVETELEAVKQQLKLLSQQLLIYTTRCKSLQEIYAASRSNYVALQASFNNLVARTQPGSAVAYNSTPGTFSGLSLNLDTSLPSGTAILSSNQQTQSMTPSLNPPSSFTQFSNMSRCSETANPTTSNYTRDGQTASQSQPLNFSNRGKWGTKSLEEPTPIPFARSVSGASRNTAHCNDGEEFSDRENDSNKNSATFCNASSQNLLVGQSFQDQLVRSEHDLSTSKRDIQQYESEIVTAVCGDDQGDNLGDSLPSPSAFPWLAEETSLLKNEDSRKNEDSDDMSMKSAYERNQSLTESFLSSMQQSYNEENVFPRSASQRDGTFDRDGRNRSSRRLSVGNVDQRSYQESSRSRLSESGASGHGSLSLSNTVNGSSARCSKQANPKLLDCEGNQDSRSDVQTVSPTPSSFWKLSRSSVVESKKHMTLKTE